MRIRTDGEYDWRTDLYDETAERFGIGTKSGGIDLPVSSSLRYYEILSALLSIPT